MLKYPDLCYQVSHLMQFTKLYTGHMGPGNGLGEQSVGTAVNL